MTPVPAARRLFLLAEPRSGSSWLRDTLDSTPRICLAGEILNPSVSKEAAAFVGMDERGFPACLRHVEASLEAERERKRRRSPSWLGCKILTNQLPHLAPGFPRCFLEAHRGAAFLLLRRENAVERQVSLCLAKAHDDWHRMGDAPPERRTVRVDPAAFVRELDRVEAWTASQRGILSDLGAETLDLTYERLFADPGAETDRILSFLGVAPGGLRFSRERKGNPFRPAEVVENHAELASALAARPAYARMLEAANAAGGAR